MYHNIKKPFTLYYHSELSSVLKEKSDAVARCCYELQNPASITGRIGKEVKPAATVSGTAVLTPACLKMNHEHSCL